MNSVHGPPSLPGFLYQWHGLAGKADDDFDRQTTSLRDPRRRRQTPRCRRFCRRKFSPYEWAADVPQGGFVPHVADEDVLLAVVY